MEKVRKQTLINDFGSIRSRSTKKKLTHQPKEIVNKNGDINEWKRRKSFLIIF